MTKQLLTALLIAGLSATAKAEPVVYYCNTVQQSVIQKSRTIDLIPQRFKLFVDLGKKKIKIVGTLADDYEVIDGDVDQVTAHFNNGPNENNFYGRISTIAVFAFQKGLFTYSIVDSGVFSDSPTVRSFIANCEDF